MYPITCNSSLLHTITYQQADALLEIIFQSGAVYEYLGVPDPIYQQLLTAESQGGFFNSKIRNDFPFRKIRSAG